MYHGDRKMTYDSANNVNELDVSERARQENNISKFGFAENRTPQNGDQIYSSRETNQLSGIDSLPDKSSGSSSDSNENHSKVLGESIKEQNQNYNHLTRDHESKARQNCDEFNSESKNDHEPDSRNAKSETENNIIRSCYNKIIDDEIKARLDKLNALSDLINSLERQSDKANILFRDTLKCSTDRLSSIAKTLGTKSIKRGRIYHAAKVSVEQSQSDCQRACVQFEQANNDHHLAREAIKEAELKLRNVSGENANDVILIPKLSIDLSKLKLNGDSQFSDTTNSESKCDSGCTDSLQHTLGTNQATSTNKSLEGPTSSQAGTSTSTPSSFSSNDITNEMIDSRDTNIIEPIAQDNSYGPKNDQVMSLEITQNAAKLSEELNMAMTRLAEAEQKRCQSEKEHLDQANKLMIAQENLIKLEREYGPSIKRSQLYFNEAKQFNAKLNSVKSEINRISDEITAAKQAYALTLSELEQFSEELHEASI